MPNGQLCWSYWKSDSRASEFSECQFRFGARVTALVADGSAEALVSCLKRCGRPGPSRYCLCLRFLKHFVPSVRPTFEGVGASIGGNVRKATQ